MFSKFYSPNILATGSSKVGENSYSVRETRFVAFLPRCSTFFKTSQHHADADIGVAVIDRFTYYNLEVLEKVDETSDVSMQTFFDNYNPQLLHSTPGVRKDLFNRDLRKVSSGENRALGSLLI